MSSGISFLTEYRHAPSEDKQKRVTVIGRGVAAVCMPAHLRQFEPCASALRRANCGEHSEVCIANCSVIFDWLVELPKRLRNAHKDMSSVGDKAY
jgi:hypothetical protein